MEARLDRSFGTSRLGDEPHAKEAVAAISRCLADQLMGFGTAHVDNHAAHIKPWLKVPRGDKRGLFAAAAHAQRAVDWPAAAPAKGGVALDGGGSVDETGTAYEAEVRNVAA